MLVVSLTNVRQCGLGVASSPPIANAIVPSARSASNYGCRSQPGAHDRRCPPNQRIHHGLDIQGREGDPFYIPKAGVVTAVLPNGTMSRYGNLLLVYIPEDDVTYVFAHLKELPLWRAGEAVSAWSMGGLIGHTGACRGATGPHGTRCTPCGAGGRFLCSGAHLHWEVRPGRVTRPNPNGPSINPRTYAASKGIAIHSGAGYGLGSAAPVGGPCANVNYFCDPNGFEPGDDELEVSKGGEAAGSTAGWIAVGVGAAAALVAAILILK